MANYRTYSDSELYNLLQHGDNQSFAEIYQRYSPILYRHAYQKLRSKEDARDLIQELFVHLWDKRQDLMLTTSLSSYLYASVRNRILNLFAHQQVREKYLTSLSEFNEIDRITPDHQVRERELREQIERAVDSLPSKMRAIFILSRVEHLTQKEIAERLKISDQTVNKQVKNALRILRSKIGNFLFALFF
ncbi:RNA polymerase sigma-70 factor [Parapedobacter defluvii]|uniref:RNA polymerase sigma-70 factor n=1 Tax=Parapedobacter defluvii TaxID=2045106 RepID=UPI0033407702